MKVVHGGSNVIASHGVKSEGKFQILASAHAFRILSSGLYSDKISAVLREIGCNAADSHVAAGCPDKPIEVKLPNQLDQDFYIKDYGIGLTHDEVTGLFTTYFSSNKVDSNDLTGAFGLGSKSPFSYTDSFSVTVAKDGRQRAYTAHIGADGSPVISLLGETEAQANWPSGMMVSFPVKPGDVSEFHAKARQVFKYFRVKPDLLGGAPVPEIASCMTGEGFFFPADEQDRSSAAVVMGNVAYPLHAGKLNMEKTAIAEQTLIATGIHLVLPIGAVMPTASREELEYDPATRANISKALAKAAVEVGKRLYQQAMEPSRSEWARHARVQEYKKTLPKEIANNVERFLQLQSLTDKEIAYVKDLFGNSTVKLADWVGGDAWVPDTPGAPHTLGQKGHIDESMSFEVWLVTEYEGKNTSQVLRRRIEHGKLLRGRGAESVYLNYDDKMEIVYINSTHAYARVREYVAKGDMDMVLLVAPVYESARENLVAYAQRIANLLGEPPIKGTAELELPLLAKAARVKAADRQAAYAKAYSTEEVAYVPLLGKEAKFDRTNKVKVASVPPAGRYYATGYNVVRGNTRFYADLSGDRKKALEANELMHLAQAYQRMYKAGVPLPSIEGVAILEPGQLKRLKLKENGWKPYFTAVIEALQSKAVANVLKQRLTRMPVDDQDRYGYYGHYGTARLIGRMLEAHKKGKSKFWQYFEPKLAEFPVLEGLFVQYKYTNDPENTQAGVRIWLKQLLKYLPVVIKGIPTEMQSHELAGMLEKAYPLLKYLDEGQFIEKAEKDPQTAFVCLKQVLIPEDRLQSLEIMESVEVQEADAA